MVILRRKRVPLRRNFLHATFLAPVDRGVGRGGSRAMELIERGVVVLFEKLRIAVEGHTLVSLSKSRSNASETDFPIFALFHSCPNWGRPAETKQPSQRRRSLRCRVADCEEVSEIVRRIVERVLRHGNGIDRLSGDDARWCRY